MCRHDIRRDKVGELFSCRFCGSKFELREVTKGTKKGVSRFYKLKASAQK